MTQTNRETHATHISLAHNEVSDELVAAMAKFPPFNSPHEGLALIWEEFEELKDEVFEQYDVRSTAKMRKEAMQVAAMAIRFIVELT